ncbi:FtsK/SpoIIIE domain-containing protein [Nocardia acidivorans]|uniref:FtsK/SpoIIIE domain-containing protein n=1 Tax=Nocardia acidivorans TaxID=404580 RepID=UPI0014724FA7|nr:FtsK/SpoIIIE domain-containing protein [Nocardia acidivorans]
MKLYLEDRSPSIKDRWDGRTTASAQSARILVPRLVRATADIYGVSLWVSTVDTVGLPEFKAAQVALANAWRVREVSVTETDTPGLIRVRALVTNPLTCTVEMAPPPCPVTDWGAVPMGPDMWGDPITLPIKDASGMVVGGNPGTGKTAWCLGLITTLAPSDSVQMAVANGKAPAPMIGDYRGVAPRISHLLGSDLEEVVEFLTGLQAEMNRRYTLMWDQLGVDSFWESKSAPSPQWPVLVVLLDECQTWMQDPRVVDLTADIEAKCRGAGIFLILATQKPTDNNLPTRIRDLCTTSLCFPVRTTAAAIAALGEGLREYPEMSPLHRMRPEFRGVGTIINETSSGYTQFKAPFCTRTLAAQVAHATAHYTRDFPGITVGRGHRITAQAPSAPVRKLRVVRGEKVTASTHPTSARRGSTR